MLTKDELLQKGISEEAADEIIAAFSDDSEENSLQALEKALNAGASEPTDDLFKASDEGGEGDDKGDDDDEDKYDESYMKKYMKKYMKNNSKSCSKMMKELNLSGEKMSKAVDEFDTDLEGAVIEMADLEPILREQADVNSELVKAISAIAGQVELITGQVSSTHELMEKAARVQVEQAKRTEDFLGTPQGRKGVVADSSMAKATVIPNKLSAEDTQIVWNTLYKAVQDGDKDAGQVISAFESTGKDFNRLSSIQKQFIQGLMKQEVN